MAKVDELRKDLDDAFFLFSYDDSKKITPREVGPVIRSVGLNPTEDELKAITAECKSQQISCDILHKVVAPRAKSLRTTDEELKDCFQTFDKNGNGTVACSDLMHALSSLGERVPPEIIDELFREVDPNGEGQMLIDDLCLTMLKK